MWDRFANFVLRHRAILVAVLAVLTVFMGYNAKKAQLTYDYPKFIPDNDSDYVAYKNFKQTFGDDGSVVVIGVETGKISQLAFFKEWSELTEDLKNDNGVERVLSITNIPELIKAKKPVIFDEDTFYQEVFEQRQVFSRIPETQEELDSLFLKVKTLKFYEGLLYSDSSNLTLIAITLKKSLLDSYKRIAYIHDLQDKVDAVGKKHNLEIHYSGLPFIRTEMSNKIKEEIKFFTLLSLLVTGIILLLFFRSFYTFVFSILVVIVGVIWAMGILVLLGYKITLFIGLLPPLVVVIGIANCIYLLNKYHDEFKKHGNKMKALQRVISKVGLAVFITNLTTAVGFGVFALTGSKVLQEFGITSFLSIMSVYLISLILIPVFFSFLKDPSTKQTKHLDNKYIRKLLAKIANIITNHRKWVYGVTIFIVLTTFIGMLQVKTVGYMLDDISSRDPLYKDLKFFEREIKGVMPFEIVIDTKKPGGVRNPQVLSKIDALERELSKFPEFSKPVSIAQLIKFARQAKHDGDERFYRIPGNLELGEIMNLMPGGSSGNKMIRSLVDSTYQKARISVQMADVGSVRIKELRNEVLNKANVFFPENEYDIILTGTSIIFLKGNDYLINNLFMSLLIAFLVIAGLMASIFTSFRMIMISLIPNLVPLLFTAGIMGIFDVKLKPSTVLVFSVAFGIAVDFTIHFLSKYRMELKKSEFNIKKSVSAALNELGSSMIYTAVILFFGFIIFTASKFGGTIALGLFTSLTLVVALFSNLILLPSLLLSYDKALERKKSKQKPLIDYPDEEA
jgi:hydrophobe/amphiphile efflux-3 (HAE3) family protein